MCSKVLALAVLLFVTTFFSEFTPSKPDVLWYTQKSGRQEHIPTHYVEYAKYYDMIDNSYPWVPEYVAKMRARAQVLHYSSAFIVHGQTEFNLWKPYLLKDVTGAYWQTTGKWSGGYMIDIGNPEASKLLGQRLKGYVNEGYDGIFLDGAGPYRANTGVNGAPINPRTDEPYWGETYPYTSDIFVNDLAKHISILKSYIPNSLLIGNCMDRASGKVGYYTFNKEAFDKILSKVDGAMCEFWISHGGRDVWHSEEEWELAIKLLGEMGNRRNFIFVPTDRLDPPREQAGYYVLASFLIGATDFKESYLWSHSVEPATMSWAREIVDIDVGIPLGTYYKNSDGVYVREFTEVTVYVNPSSQVRGGMQPHTGKVVHASYGLLNIVLGIYDWLR